MPSTLLWMPLLPKWLGWKAPGRSYSGRFARQKRKRPQHSRRHLPVHKGRAWDSESGLGIARTDEGSLQGRHRRIRPIFESVF